MLVLSGVGVAPSFAVGSVTLESVPVDFPTGKLEFPTSECNWNATSEQTASPDLHHLDPDEKNQICRRGGGGGVGGGAPGSR